MKIPQPKFKVGQVVRRKDLDHVGPVTGIEININKEGINTQYFFMREDCSSCGKKTFSMGAENELELVPSGVVQDCVWNDQTQNVNKISAAFVRRMNEAGCHCGRQKLEKFPFCGLCFSALPPEAKDLLKTKRGGQLEAVYNRALEFLKGRKKR